MNVIATTWAHSPSRDAKDAKMLAILRATSRRFRNLIGTPKSIRDVRERKERVRRILNRRRYLMGKTSSPLTAEERAFLEYYNFAKMRGNAYRKRLAPTLNRQNYAYTTDPLQRVLYNRRMRQVVQLPDGRGYYVRPVRMYPYHRNVRTGKKVLVTKKWKDAVRSIVRSLR